MTKKIALIGCGKIALKHIEAIKYYQKKKKLKLVAICENNLKKLDELKIPLINKYTKIGEMLKKEQIDIISILTPSGLHYQHFMQCKNYVKTIVIEKPIALKTSDAKKMMIISKNKNINLFVVLQNRFNPVINFLKKNVENGKLGKIFLTTIRLRWSRGLNYYKQAKWRGTWKYDGGVIANQCAHHIDLLQWISGMPSTVQSQMINVHKGKKVEDTALAILTYNQSNKLGMIEATTATRPKDIEGSISVLGTKGSIVLSGFTSSKIETCNYENMSNKDKKIIKINKESIKNVYNEGHKKFYKYVIDSIKKKSDVNFLDGKEALKSLKIINGIYKSSRKNKKVRINKNFDSFLGK